MKGRITAIISVFFAHRGNAYQIRPGFSLSWKAVLKLKSKCPCSKCFLYFKEVSKNWENRHSANKEIKAALLQLQGQMLSCNMTDSVSCIPSCNARKYSSASRTLNVQGSATWHSMCNSSYQLLLLTVSYQALQIFPRGNCIFGSLFQEEVNSRHFSCFVFSPEQVKIQPVARYDWEQKYYYGNLIAVSNSYLAYAIRGEIPSCLACDLYSISYKLITLGGCWLNAVFGQGAIIETHLAISASGWCCSGNVSEVGAMGERRVGCVGEFPLRKKAFLKLEIKEREGRIEDGGKVEGLHWFHWTVS